MRLVSFRTLSSTSPAGRAAAPGPGVALLGLMAVTLLAPSPVLAAESTAPKPPTAVRGEEPSLDAFFAALATAPDDASAARARGRIEARWNASGSVTADLLSARAATAAHAGDRALALDLLDAVIVVAPTWANAHHHRALLNIARDDFGHAAADLAETLRLEPRHIGAMTTAVALAEASGRKAEALKWLRRLAAIDPRNPGLGARLERLTIEVEGREL